MSEHISIQLQEGILRIGINRPQKKNALTIDMYQALADAIEAAEANSDVRVILLHGTEDCFTSGNDLKDFLNASSGGEPTAPARFLAAISQAKKPLVAAVVGPAVGIGTTLLLHCDLVYAGEKARFQLPFVNLGLCPEAACSYLLPQLVGYHRAAELLLLGEPMSAAEAQRCGLVNQVVADQEVLTTALVQAAKLAAQPPAAIALTKSLLKRRDADTVSQIMAEELRLFGERLKSPECKEAITAFFERRKPNFSSLGG